MPDGIDFQFRADDPILAQAKTIYHDIQMGKLSGQEGFSRLLSLHAGLVVQAAQRQSDNYKAEVVKLGASGPARIDALTTFFKAHLGEADGLEFMSSIRSAKGAEAAEKLVAKFSGQGTGTFKGTGREAPTAPGRLSDADYNKLTTAQKLDYARKFDQSQFQTNSGRAA